MNLKSIISTIWKGFLNIDKTSMDLQSNQILNQILLMYKTSFLFKHTSKNIQVTPEQHGFEWCRSTHRWILFKKYSMTQSSRRTLVCRGLTVKLHTCVGFQLYGGRGGGTSTPALFNSQLYMYFIKVNIFQFTLNGRMKTIYYFLYRMCL